MIYSVIFLQIMLYFDVSKWSYQRNSQKHHIVRRKKCISGRNPCLRAGRLEGRIRRPLVSLIFTFSSLHHLGWNFGALFPVFNSTLNETLMWNYDQREILATAFASQQTVYQGVKRIFFRSALSFVTGQSLCCFI